MMQVIWEEMLHRFADLEKLEDRDLERFYQSGFREGYQRLLTRLRGNEGESPRPDEKQGTAGGRWDEQGS